MNEENIKNSTTKTITIPNGVKVIEVYASAVASTDNYDAMTLIEVSSNNKVWLANESVAATYVDGYVGVTPNKQYTVKVRCANSDSFTTYIDTFQIIYSPEINNKTPIADDY